MRRFVLLRTADISGVSGPGKVVEGMQASDGTVAFRWCVDGKPHSWVVYDSIQDVITNHGHDGATHVVWIDPPLPNLTDGLHVVGYADGSNVHCNCEVGVDHQADVQPTALLAHANGTKQPPAPDSLLAQLDAIFEEARAKGAMSARDGERYLRRCNELNRRGLSAELTKDLKAAGNLALVAELEAASDHDLKRLSLAHAAHKLAMVHAEVSEA